MPSSSKTGPSLPEQGCAGIAGVSPSEFGYHSFIVNGRTRHLLLLLGILLIGGSLTGCSSDEVATNSPAATVEHDHDGDGKADHAAEPEVMEPAGAPPTGMPDLREPEI